MRRLRGADDRDLDIAPCRVIASIEPKEQTASERDDVHVSDPLDELRATLGPGLAARLPDAPPARGLRDAPIEDLEAIVDETRAAIDVFPAAEVLELRRLQRDRESRPASVTARPATRPRCSANTTASAASSATHAAGSPSASMPARAAPRPRNATSTARPAANPAAAGDRHPSPWVARHGDGAVQWAQARRGSTSATSYSCATPSSKHGRHAAAARPRGPRRDPHRGAERHRYDELAADLEEWRLRHDVDIDRDGVLGRPCGGP